MESEDDNHANRESLILVAVVILMIFGTIMGYIGWRTHLMVERITEPSRIGAAEGRRE